MGSSACQFAVCTPAETFSELLYEENKPLDDFIKNVFVETFCKRLCTPGLAELRFLSRLIGQARNDNKTFNLSNFIILQTFNFTNFKTFNFTNFITLKTFNFTNFINFITLQTLQLYNSIDTYYVYR
jgi:hypothetical protein